MRWRTLQGGTSNRPLPRCFPYRGPLARNLAARTIILCRHCAGAVGIIEGVRTHAATPWCLRYWKLFDKLTPEAGRNVAYQNAFRMYFEGW